MPLDPRPDDKSRVDPASPVYTGLLVAKKRRRAWPRILGRTVFVAVAVASVTAATAFSFASASTGSDPRSSLTLIAPAGVGGGWDGFSREQQQAMRLDGLVNNVQVVNIPGAGGTIGLGSFASTGGQTNTLLATGAAMVGGIEINDSPVGFDDVRLVARVAEDYSVFIVKSDAPWDDVDELAEAWAADPAGIRFTGGSTGSIDHLLVAQFAQVLGISPAETTYIPKSGGAEATQTILSDTADVAVTGYNEVADQIDAGRVRAIALSAPQQLDGVDIPTFEEAGYAVDLVNWRGFVAAKDISDEDFEALREIVRETAQSEAWADALARNRWVDSYLEGPDFEEFLEADQASTAALVKELGL